MSIIKPALPVRIAQVIGIMRNGGVESVIFGYYKNIDRSKIQYDFIIDADSTHTHEDFINSMGGKIIVVPPYQKAAEYHKALYKLFTENNYPLVYSHMNTMSVFPLFAAWRAGVPLRVAHSHTTAGKGKGETARNIMKYTLRNFSRIFPTHMCACSKLAGEFQFGRRAVDSGRVRIWQNAIETERFAYNETVRNETRRKLKLSDKFIVGHSGRFMPQKNHDFLVDIFAEILRRRENSVLLLAGEGPLMEDVREKVSRLGLNDSVIFAGDVQDAEKYYQAMDVFIFPSLYEGLGMSVVEAQVSGLPVIASTELPIDAKICDNFHFFPLKKSAGEWADEALKISDGHIRRDMSIYAREAGFDVKTQGARMSEWYCQLLGI
ncbi:MAG: glycosyltransferase family 1 protein [Synergistaceae bacterium]|nr:glycosyltransferase family 1 protein [Synergistaceae bacterium]